jgi:hypothetical protein
MNPFEYIKELKQTIVSEAKEVGVSKDNDGPTMTAKEHYIRTLNLLSLLETSLKDAEYNYEIESIHNTIKTFEEYTVFQEELNDDVIIFQPIAVTDNELSSIDMNSLADILTKLRDSGEIKENILLLPPDINVFRAKLSKTTE